MQVEVNGRKIDLSTVFPLLTKDWKALGKLGVTPIRLASSSGDVDALSAYVLYVLKKSDPATTAEEIDNLAFTRLLHLLREIGAYESSVDKVDLPLSTPPTSSDESTAGPSGTLSS